MATCASLVALCSAFSVSAQTASASTATPEQEASCVASEATWMRIDPKTYFLSGVDRCGGNSVPTVVLDDGRATPLSIDSAGLFDGSVELPPGDHVVSIRYSNGASEELFVASVDAPLEFDVTIEDTVTSVGSDPATTLGLPGVFATANGNISTGFQANALDWETALTVNGRAFNSNTLSNSGNQLSLETDALVQTGPGSIEALETRPQGSRLSERPVFGGTDSAVASLANPLSGNLSSTGNNGFVSVAPDPAAQSAGNLQVAPLQPVAPPVAPLEISAENSVWALMNRRAYAQAQLDKQAQSRRLAAQEQTDQAETADKRGGGLFGFLSRGNNSAARNSRTQNAQVASLDTAERVYPSDQDYFTVELIWNSPVDLDLHVFEPRAAGPRLANSNAPGHIWPKASSALRSLAKGSVYLLESLPQDSANREVYILPYNTVGALGDYDIRIDYADRRLRQNSDPAFCGGGALASVRALVRIRTPQLKREETVTIQPLSCSSTTNLNLLLPVSVVSLY